MTREVVKGKINSFMGGILKADENQQRVRSHRPSINKRMSTINKATRSNVPKTQKHQRKALQHSEMRQLYSNGHCRIWSQLRADHMILPLVRK